MLATADKLAVPLAMAVGTNQWEVQIYLLDCLALKFPPSVIFVLTHQTEFLEEKKRIASLRK